MSVRPTLTTLGVLLLMLFAPPLATRAADEVPILSTLEAKQPVWSLAFAPDGQKLMVCGGDDHQHVQVWDLTNRKVVALRGHNKGVHRVAATLDGTLFASSGADTHVVVWDAATNEEKFSLKKHRKDVNGLAFTPEGKYLVSGCKGFMVYVWDLKTKKPVAALEGYGPISYLKCAPDGQTIALGTDHGQVAIWDTAEPRKLLFTRIRHEGFVHRLAYAPDCKTLASTDGKGNLVLWDVATGKLLQEFRGAAASSVAFSPKGSTLAVGYHDGSIRLWDATGTKEKATLKGHNGRYWITDLAYSPDGKALASGSNDSTVKIWNVSGLGR
jgi:WD40 repeat protein